MFVHKELVELKEKHERAVKDLEKTIESLERNLWKWREGEDLRKQGHHLKIEEAKAEIRKQMQKDLIESDLRRVKAEACLETYKAMDTKTDREQIRKMLDKAITSLGQKVAVQVVK